MISERVFAYILPQCTFPLTNLKNRSATTREGTHKKKQAPRVVDEYLLVSSEESKMNVAQEGAVSRGELNMCVVMEAPVERSVMFLDLVLVGGPVHVRWKCEPRERKKSFIFF